MNSKYKLALGAIIAFFIIIGTILTALSILKEEAVSNYVKIAQLNAKAFSKELNQDLSNIEQTILNIPSILNSNKKNINTRLKDIIRRYPQIRSINILKDNLIVNSSNLKNIDLSIETSNFYPKPLFNENILRVSSPWYGRDFFSGIDVYKNDELVAKEMNSFIPILKRVKTNNGFVKVVINLNSDYFENRFLTNLESDDIIFELIRVDGIVLLSTNEFNKIGKKIDNIKILDELIEKSVYSNIEFINGKKYILNYMITANYPLGLAVKLDYEKNLLSWNKKQYDFFTITTGVIVLSIFTALLFFYKSNKLKEKELRLHKLQVQNQEKFRLLFQDSHFLASVTNKDGKILETNNIALKLLGKDLKTLINTKFWDLDCFLEKDRRRLKGIISSNNNNKFQDEIVIFDKDRNERIIDITISSIYIEQEKLLVIIGVDNTQRVQREEKLKQAYTVFDNTRDGIMITDKNTNIIDVNKAFEKITGYKKAEVIGQKTSVLKSNTHTKQFYENMWKSILSDGYWEGEIINRNKNSKKFTEWLTINTIFDEQRNIVSFIGVFSDITEQKQKEKLLKEKDEALYQQSKLAAMGEMIGNIAHQWRQPLSIISSSSTGLLLQKDLGLSNKEDDIKVLKSINSSAQYLSQTIDDFRNFLQVDKEIKLFSINDTIKDSLALANLNTKNKEIKLFLNLEDSLEVYGIRNEFIQVMLNILKNAKDALKNKDGIKYICIESGIDGNYVYVKVKDNAGGIPEDIITRIFEPYFTTKHKAQGTGIGLYMSEEIIKNHMKGKISVENQNYPLNNTPQKGACFKIELPLI